METISPKELMGKIKGSKEVYILDVRAEEKYEEDHIRDNNVQSVNISKTKIFNLDETDAESLSVLPKNKEIIVTCTTGNSARKCAAILAGKEYNVTLLDGGITAWKDYLAEK
ncbi:hypothetical protein GCM10009865_03350 [Aeromicrobium ponti]|uniref:Rhodanese-related sulfurtransferase n=1 Tax=Cytobacillus oceanisediminis TaxID=665099 RepID=A0A562K5S1_9BACI|nr:rhodanese-like domain-containing protein [Cytobacillus oceanisediminis]TWH90791.1 rhodanese-related sulfurtransferase [Cytobacillus oceanisediminis]